MCQKLHTKSTNIFVGIKNHHGRGFYMFVFYHCYFRFIVFLIVFEIKLHFLFCFVFYFLFEMKQDTIMEQDSSLQDAVKLFCFLCVRVYCFSFHQRDRSH